MILTLEQFHYKCPNEDKCPLHKHCHVLKTSEKLKQKIAAYVKCDFKKKEILVTIGETVSTYKIRVTHRKAAMTR